jgi:lysyl-tRNA synthetase class 2
VTTALAESERRRVKTARLRARGIDPFPHLALGDRNLIADVPARLDDGRLRHGDGAGACHLAGRLVGRRTTPRATFLELRDRSGTMPLRVAHESPTAESLHNEVVGWDIGDIVAVSGRPLRGKGGEVGLDVDAGRLLTKALQLNHGLSQADHTTRRRELDLMASAELRQRFITRSALVGAIREWMNDREFVEVETPILQPRPGGALARPFSTRHNALSRDLALRISTQLYLRRCTIGDMERVYEIGRCFRNEGMSPRHNPEFTVLEWSMAYGDYRDSAALAERLVADVAERVLGRSQVTYKDATIDLATPWRRITVRDAIKSAAGVDILTASRAELGRAATRAAKSAASLSLAENDDWWSDAVDVLYQKCVEPHLTQPTIVLDFPLAAHPCTKPHTEHGDRLAESFDIVLGGVELASGGTEVNDPDEQLRRFVAQSGGRNGADHDSDAEYMAAMAYGAPPSAGGGIGIDRLMMILLDCEAISEATIFSTEG